MRTVRKQVIKDTLSDLVSCFLYYDRKEDSDLFVGEIDDAVEAGEITIEEMVDQFRQELIAGLKDES